VPVTAAAAAAAAAMLRGPPTARIILDCSVELSYIARTAPTLTASAGEAGGQGFDVAGDGRGLHALVAAKKSYPVLARRMGLEGVTRLRVRVRADGTLDGSPAVTASSGHALLDREALRMVEASAPFPSFVDSGRGAIALILTIRFSLDEA
jgi:TonB family protein